MTPQISIIIAMYNIEKYIAECIESCLHQECVSPEEYEIIVVNDGSTDNSLRVAERALSCASNARIITQKNAGVSVARNTGIANAKGEYVWFVDGDDRIAANGVKTLIDECEKTSCDIYIFNYQTFGKEGAEEASDFERYDTPLSGKYINNELKRTLPVLVWAAIYRRQFLIDNSLSFMPGIRHEDDEFCLRVNYLASSILILQNVLYYYRTNEQSFMSKIKADNTVSFLSRLKIRDSLNAFFGKDNDFYNDIKAHESFILITYRYYDSFNRQNIRKYNEVKWSLYRDVLRYGSIKRKAFVLSAILLPFPIVKIILQQLH